MSAFRTLSLPVVAVAVATMAPTPALAHPGHGAEVSAGLLGGLLHPWTGLDHLVALVLAGAWAALLGGRAILRLPAALLVGMVAGFAMAPTAGVALAEAMTAVATVSLVLVALLRLRAPLRLASSACAVFGFGHGLAHGLESTGSTAAFAGGMVMSSLLLMALGIGGARMMERSPVLALLAQPTGR